MPKRDEWLDLGMGEVLYKDLVTVILTLEDFELCHTVEFKEDMALVKERGYQTAFVTTAGRCYFSKKPIDVITSEFFYGKVKP